LAVQDSKRLEPTESDPNEKKTGQP
jgi:hypothetical protein